MQPSSRNMTIVITVFAILHVLLSINAADPPDGCPPLSHPSNGILKILRNTNVLAYSVHCNKGYVASANFVVCARGQWDKPQPECLESTKVKQCVSLPAPVNGAKHCVGALVVGKTCTFRCHNGYSIVGNRIRRCLENLEWSDTDVKCVPQTGPVCNPPSTLQHGTVIDCLPSNLLRPGGKCTFRCSLGYVLQGPGELFCRYNGKLTDAQGRETSPKCLPAERAPGENPGSDEEENDNDQNERHSPPANPCEHENGGCEQLCKIEDGVKRCRCNKGFKIAQDGIHCNPVKRVPPQNFNPCQRSNGGCFQICDNNNGVAQCRCENGYRLAEDRKSCVAIEREPPQWYDPCQHRNGGCMQTCTVENNLPKCDCKEGYTLAGDRRRCIDVNECNLEPRVCHQKCHNTIGSYRCSCLPGYRMFRDMQCRDIDECADERLHRCHHKCQNTIGSYTCSCLPGYIQIDSTKCEGCRKNSYRSAEDNSCTECPSNSHTVFEGKVSIADCMCNPGFEGDPSENIPCEDINECADGNFGCSHTCVNTPGSVHCACPAGFELQQDNKTCSDIDECSIKNGGCQGNCENTVGDFICSCPYGYTPSESDRYSCDDIDECADDNGGCSHKCENHPGGFYCSCNEGHRLDSTQKKCIAIQCPRVPTAATTTMTCKMKANSASPPGNKSSTILPEQNEYQFGTICNFKCPKGFKLDTTGNIVCQADGTWSGTASECVALQCPPLQAPENGGIHPKSCTNGHVSVKQKCTFYCNPGYELTDKFIFVCKNSLAWSVEEPPKCKLVNKSPFISCPEDIFVNLQPGENSTNVTIPEPSTNMQTYSIYPEGLRVASPNIFPSGKTDVTFTATNTLGNETTECKMSINVLDKEPPTFYSCPGFIEVDGAHAYGVPVLWEEPLVVDNVGVVSLTKSMEPNSLLTPGVHNVEYTATDAAGNFATCSFEINVTQAQCSHLKDPINGEANCVDWMFGKICEPLCLEGFIRHPDSSQFYTCDDSGVWSPSEDISPCLQYFPASSSDCTKGFELKTRNDTGEDICLECSAGTIWSVISKKCEDQPDEILPTAFHDSGFAIE